MEQRLARQAATEVAQIFNLLYRRIAFGRVLDRSDALALSEAPQITNLRYGRVQLCATAARHGQRCGFRTSGFGFLSDFVLRNSDLHIHFPEIDLACRIIHSSFFGRASAP
jgi:phosphoserine phosphatase